MKNLNKYILFFSAFFLILILSVSCSKTKTNVFISDRHGLSFNPVKLQILTRSGNKENANTLVLFDHHNDVSSDLSSVKSYNWVGNLIDEGLVNKVIWVSALKLNDLEIASRKNWLINNMEKTSLEFQEKVLSAFEIIDFETLSKRKLKNAVITFDFDILTENCGQTFNEQSAFIKKAIKWMKKNESPLVTLALSAVYQANPEETWNWLVTFLENADFSGDWYFQSGYYNEQNESNEDLTGWANWKKSPQIFNRYENSFYKGAYLWLNAPLKIQKLLGSKNLAPFGGSATENVIQIFNQANKNNSSDFNSLNSFKTMEHMTQIARNAIEQTVDGKMFYPLEQNISFTNPESKGIAVRIRTTEKDKGCYALYSCKFEDASIEYAACEAAKDPRYGFLTSTTDQNLFINITIFDSWTPMEDCYDFIPGYDSLLIEDLAFTNKDEQFTLLQSAIASEYNCSKDDFLERICRKAKLPADYYKTGNLKFYKAASITFTDGL